MLNVLASPYRNLVPLFTDAAWTKHANATSSPDGKTLTLNATAAWQSSSYVMTVAPGTRMTIDGVVTASASNGFISVYPVRNGVQDTSGLASISQVSPGPKTFTVPYGVTTIKVWCENQGAGTFTFDNITLKAVQPASPFANLVPLFTDPAWTKHANATSSPDGKTLTLNATAQYQHSTLTVPVTPNTALTIAGTLGFAVGAPPWFLVRELDASGVTLKDTISLKPTSGSPYAINTTFTTSMRTTQIKVYCSNEAVAGTFTFSNLTLRPAQPAFDPAKVPPSYFKELVTNGGFDQGATGWTLHANASVSGGKLVLNATSASQQSYPTNAIPATPNTTYELTATVTENVAGGACLTFGEYTASTGAFLRSANAPTATNGRIVATFTTTSRTTYIRPITSCFAAGTFTFDNISLKRKAP